MASVESSISEVDGVRIRLQEQQGALNAMAAEAETVGGGSAAVKDEIDGAAGKATAAAASLDRVQGATTALGYGRNAREVGAARDGIEQARAVIHGVGGVIEGLAKAMHRVKSELEATHMAMSRAHDTLGQARDRLYALTLKAGATASGGAAGTTTAGGNSRVRGPARDKPVRPPNSRHELDRIDGNSVAKSENTVILPHVDIQADLDAIADGKATWDHAKSEFHVGNRIYKVKKGNRLYPVRGEGLIEMSRPQYKALRALIAAGGDKAKVRQNDLRSEHISPADWEKAATVFKLRSSNESGSEGS